ncbi:MAG: DUF2939 domain-containing protein [Hyphomicrobium sp.]|jgi:hypothetical protein
MRKALYALLATALLAVGYVAAPVVAAWSIREAIENGNSGYLKAKIEWDTVRMSLRESLTRAALDLPDAAGGEPQPKPSLWQRIKNSFSQRAVDSMISNYVNAEGLPQLFTYRKFYRESISGEAAAEAARPWRERVASFWSRIKRAEFKSPTSFEIEMADRHDPSRVYVGLLKLRGIEWKLCELRLRVSKEAALPVGLLSRA